MASDPRHFSKKTKRLAWHRCAGQCEFERPNGERCPMPVGPGNVIYDHVDPWHLSRNSSLENCQVICVRCDREKTFGRDIPLIAEIRRASDFHRGISGPGKGDGDRMPCGRASPQTRSLRGRVGPRLSQSQKHFLTMRNRYGSFS